MALDVFSRLLPWVAFFWLLFRRPKPLKVINAPPSFFSPHSSPILFLSAVALLFEPPTSLSEPPPPPISPLFSPPPRGPVSPRYGRNFLFPRGRGDFRSRWLPPSNKGATEFTDHVVLDSSNVSLITMHRLCMIELVARLE